MDKSSSKLKYGRRRSRSLGGILNAREICKTIRKSLSSSQKLQLLLQYALEHGLSMAEKDLCEDIDDDAFKKAISKCQVNIESEIEEKNYCSLAVADKESNDLNASLRLKYEEYSSAVTKLEEEIRQWDELLARYRSNLNEEMNVTDIQFNGEVNFEQYQHLDYSTILEDVESIDSHLNYQIKKLKKTSIFLTRYTKLANKGILSWSKDAGKTFLKPFEDSPRRLIKKCI
ncbi:uncharacterized protein LOC129988943 [Argiope bruennichi]|uniref:uncharacterized protein LOC129988943 n=1 Tax=Argiope bruennichi TaxID=94029 RepID=UPI00249471F4|nr:uncharacterized protein LOC129988943 [Argiope bruennichi]